MKSWRISRIKFLLISTLEDLDKVGYAEDILTLRKELAVAVLHQVKMMKQRTEQYKQTRAAEDAADTFANQLVTSATHSIFPRSTPLSALGSPDLDATQYLPTPEVIVEEDEDYEWIQFENASQFDKLLTASFGKVVAGSDSSWTRVQPTLLDFTRVVTIRDFLGNVALDEELDVLHKWIRLIAQRLNVPVEPYLLKDGRSSKKQRGNVDVLRVVPDSLEAPYVQNALLDIDDLMK